MADEINASKTVNDNGKNRTIILIHGLWMTPLSWEHFKERFEELGYNVLTPGWPGHEGDIEDVRRNAPEKIADLGLNDVVEHYEKIIHEMEWPAILIGHSFGGLIVQILLDKGYGSAGVGIDSAAPKGVHKLTYAELKSAFPVLSRAGNRHKAVSLTFEEFHYAFANNMSGKDAKKIYDRYAIPDTGRAVFESVFDDFSSHAPTNVNYKNNKRSPLLLIAGSDDHTVPAAVSKSNYDKYNDSTALTDFHEFEGRSHLIMLEEGWEEVVDYIDQWITKTLK
jgi:pimeloyl-ACP methyl ester carboxylesterase